jgi:predicted metalloprotease
MKWQGRRQSDNVVDRRRIGGRGLAIGGGIGGVGGIVLLVLYLLLGGNPTEITQSFQGEDTSASSEAGQLSQKDQEMGEFVAVVLADIEDVWNEQFRRLGEDYREPRLVLFTGQVESACGYSSAAVGPFYCPADENVYLDLDFFEDMQRELEAQGDFALAYVIAHEVGHHVQNLLGISEEVSAQQARMSERQANQLSVRLELQADFLAGVWAHYARESRDFLDNADIEEGINAAGAVGDDRIMRQSQGYVVPDAFTHGTSEQRVRWFRKGLESGDLSQGDTFSASRL